MNRLSHFSRLPLQRVCSRGSVHVIDRVRDRVFGVKVGDCRLTFVDCTNTARSAASAWNMSKEAHIAWGQAASATIIYAGMLRGEERVIFTHPGTENCGGIYVESFAIGEVRGFAREGTADDSACSVQRILYGQHEPYTSIVASSGDLEKDWQAIQDKSEQRDGKIFLYSSTHVEPFSFRAVLIERIPGTAEDKQVFDSTAGRLQRLKTSGEWEDMTIVGMAKEAIQPEDLTSNLTRSVPVDYFCRCTKESFLGKLSALAPETLKSLTDGPAGSEPLVLTCSFCNRPHPISSEELEPLLKGDIPSK